MMNDIADRVLPRDTDELTLLHHRIGGDSAGLWRWLEKYGGSGRKILKAMKRGHDFQQPLPGLAEKKVPKVDPRVLLRRADAHALGWHDPQYPGKAKNRGKAPAVLYAKGDIGVLNTPSVAIVGSRRATKRACNLAFTIARDLAAHGVTVVSGLAAGIDAAAHRGALETGRTVAVIGCGIDRVYPSQHAALSRQITRQGAIVSQFPCGSPPIAYHFPLRNVTIARLVRAVLVVEAPIRSGALVTAKFAPDFDAEIMACPGDAGRPSCQGSNLLLKDGGIVIESAADVLTALNLLPLSGKKVEQSPKQTAETQVESDFLRYFAGEAASVDELVERSGRTVAQVRAILTELEIYGAVIRLEGDRFDPIANGTSRSSS